MEEKQATKISLSTFLLIIAVIAIIIMGVFIYKLNNDKTREMQKSENLQSQVNSLNGTVSDLQGKINTISLTLNTNSSNTSASNNATNTKEDNNNASTSTTKSNSTNSSVSKSEKIQAKEKKYDEYIGTWYNSSTQNEITIKNITNNKITFTWFLYRLTGIDDDTTLNFSNGEATFYFEGYDDKNYDGMNTEDEKYIRKATIKLEEDGVNVNVENVTSLNYNYTILDDPSFVYITEGVYSHSNKR